MNKVLKTVLILVVLVVLGLSTACTLKASTPPPTTATPTGELNFLTPTTVAGGIATQTAVAKPQVATATVAPTAVPNTAVQPTAVPQSQSSSSSSSPTIPTLERPTTYTLQKGEWPICIARRYDLDLATLFAQNGLNMNSKPATGTVLKIASSGTWNASAYGPRELRPHVDYKVGANDSVYSIACYFGDVSPEGILAANGLSNASQVQSGMTLKIP
jgi:LysM repeat protein